MDGCVRKADTEEVRLPKDDQCDSWLLQISFQQITADRCRWRELMATVMVVIDLVR